LKPLPPVKPPEKLPLIHQLTLVRAPQDPDCQVVVMTQMRGDIVIKRKVISEAFLSKNDAMDEFMRLATRSFFFDEAEQLMEA
jgi:hypothetical protein